MSSTLRDALDRFCESVPISLVHYTDSILDLTHFLRISNYIPRIGSSTSLALSVTFSTIFCIMMFVQTIKTKSMQHALFVIRQRRSFGLSLNAIPCCPVTSTNPALRSLVACIKECGQRIKNGCKAWT